MADSRSKTSLINILVPPIPHDGCWWYRVRNFANVAKEENLAYVKELLPKEIEDEKLLETFVESCDVFLFRFTNEKIINFIKVFKKKYPHKPVIFDTDDDIFNLSPLNAAYANFGTKEVKLKDGSWLWEHGKGGFDLYENKKRTVDYEFCLAESDLVLTTTLRLANKIKEYNEAVAVIPNAINFDYWPILDLRKEKGRVDLVYAGGASHFEDLMMIKEGVKILLKKYPHLYLNLVGSTFGAFLKELPEDRIKKWPWIEADGHGYRMACVGADIGIAPLVDNEFNANKSCVKWYEYSALKIPSVLSNVPPYSDEVQDGVNGLLFNDVDDFVKKVSLLIEDPLKRAEIGENAYRWVKENRDVRKIVLDWVEIIKKTVEVLKNESLSNNTI